MCAVISDEKALSLVCHLIYQVNGVLPQEIKAQHSLINDLEMDSVEMIDFLMRLEEFGVAIEESQLSDSLTVGQIAQMLLL